MNFTNRISAVRREAGYETQSDLARASGVDHSVICRAERPGTIPHLATLVRLARTLHCSVDDLISFEEGARTA